MSIFYDTVVALTDECAEKVLKERKAQKLRRMRKQILDQAEKGKNFVLILLPDRDLALSLSEIIDAFDNRFQVTLLQGSDDEPEHIKMEWGR